MDTSSIGTQNNLDRKTNKGMYWAAGVALIVVIGAALMMFSPRNNATNGTNQGNNMTNTNSGTMNTNGSAPVNNGGTPSNPAETRSDGDVASPADTNSPEAKDNK